eukprot:3503911-Prymnesium_polylepis.1
MASGANETTPVGCSSGMVTGTVRRLADTATCVVAALELPDNRLSGLVNISFKPLPFLKELILRDNSLVGPLPPGCAPPVATAAATAA